MRDIVWPGGNGQSGRGGRKGENAESETEFQFPIEKDFDGVIAGLGEFETAEEGDIGGVEFGGGKIKRGVGGGEFPFVIGGEDADPLGEAALARGPAGVYAKFENTEWDDGGGEDVDDADKAVGTIDFETDVFADKSGLEIGNHGESVGWEGYNFRTGEKGPWSSGLSGAGRMRGQYWTMQAAVVPAKSGRSPSTTKMPRKIGSSEMAIPAMNMGSRRWVEWKRGR
jgi:hypothetical protein